MIEPQLPIWSAFASMNHPAAVRLHHAIQLVIYPPFLRRLDHWLVIHHPIIWSSSLHILLWRSLLVTLALVLAGSWIPMNIAMIPFAWLIVLVVMLFQLMALARWLRLSRTIELEYGQTSPWRSYLEIVLYTLCAVCIFAPSLACTGALKLNAASRFDERQMSADISAAETVITAHLLKLRTDLPEDTDESTAASDDCQILLGYAEQVEQVDSAFLDRLAIDDAPMGGYNYASAGVIKSTTQLSAYCTTLSAVKGARDFAFSQSGYGEVAIYTFHGLVLLSGWLLLNSRYDPQVGFTSLLTALFTPAILAVIAYFISYLIDLATGNTDQAISNMRFRNTMAITFALVTFASGLQIFTLSGKDQFVLGRSYWIASFPILLALTAVLVNVVLETSFRVQAFTAVTVAVAIVVLIPTLKHQQTKLHSLPRE